MGEGENVFFFTRMAEIDKSLELLAISTPSAKNGADVGNWKKNNK